MSNFDDLFEVSQSRHSEPSGSWHGELSNEALKLDPPIKPALRVELPVLTPEMKMIGSRTLEWADLSEFKEPGSLSYRVHDAPDPSTSDWPTAELDPPTDIYRGLGDSTDVEELVHHVVQEVITQLRPWLTNRFKPVEPELPVLPITESDGVESSEPQSVMSELTVEPSLNVDRIPEFDVSRFDHVPHANLGGNGEVGSSTESVASPQQVRWLQGQVDLLLLREEKFQRQIQNHEAEIEHLHHEKDMLEQALLELPELYRRKFMERLEPVRERIEQIQAENYQLRVDMHELNCKLHQKQPLEDLDPPRWTLRLPQLPRLGRHD